MSFYDIFCGCRLKAGLKLHEEAEKREVEKGIHLLQDPEGIMIIERGLCHYFKSHDHHMFV